MIRPARPDELAAVMSVLDAAALEVDAGTVRRRIPGGVLVAVDGGPPLGAVVLAPRDRGARVEAIAVRPGRRGQGIGTSLIGAAAARHGRLVADFDADLRPFYEPLGFSISPVGEGRLRGVLESTSSP